MVDMDNMSAAILKGRGRKGMVFSDLMKCLSSNRWRHAVGVVCVRQTFVVNICINMGRVCVVRSSAALISHLVSVLVSSTHVSCSLSQIRQLLERTSLAVTESRHLASETWLLMKEFGRVGRLWL